MSSGNLTTNYDAINVERPKRLHSERPSVFNAESSSCSLELDGILRLLKAYGDDDYVGGINCRICGKLYKSKVCFVKHVWEHSIYWKLFEGEKNQTRVLSIQAALILYNSNHGDQEPVDNNLLNYLLVTAPQDKKKDANGNYVRHYAQRKSPYKRRKSNSLSEGDDKS